MVYTNFLHMQQEISLVAVIVLLLIYDIFRHPEKLEIHTTGSLPPRGHTHPVQHLSHPGRHRLRGHVPQHGHGQRHENHPRHRHPARLHASQQLALRRARHHSPR